ncbi:MAG: class I SAM-dependent methyltransferase [Blautia faecis]
MAPTGKTMEAGCPTLSFTSLAESWNRFIESFSLIWTMTGEGKILEVGCGSGALTIRSALTWPKAKVIGVDYWGAVYNYSKALCEKNAASEGVASRCVFQHGDAKQLDFPDESFDVVISSYVYHNVIGADMQKLLLESLRVLKKRRRLCT